MFESEEKAGNSKMFQLTEIFESELGEVTNDFELEVGGVIKTVTLADYFYNVETDDISAVFEYEGEEYETIWNYEEEDGRFYLSGECDDCGFATNVLGFFSVAEFNREATEISCWFKMARNMAQA